MLYLYLGRARYSLNILSLKKDFGTLEKKLCKPYTKWLLFTNKGTTQNGLFFFLNPSTGGYWIGPTWSGEYAFIGKHPEWGTIKPDLFSCIWFCGCSYKARLAEWWKHLPLSNVAQVRCPDPLSYVESVGSLLCS